MWHDRKLSCSTKGRESLRWPSGHLVLKQGSALMETAWLPPEKYDWEIFE